MQLRLSAGNKGFRGWLAAKVKFGRVLAHAVEFAEGLDEFDDAEDPLAAFRAMYIPAMEMVDFDAF